MFDFFKSKRIVKLRAANIEVTLPLNYIVNKIEGIYYIVYNNRPRTDLCGTLDVKSNSDDIVPCSTLCPLTSQLYNRLTALGPSPTQIVYQVVIKGLREIEQTQQVNYLTSAALIISSTTDRGGVLQL